MFPKINIGNKEKIFLALILDDIFRILVISIFIVMAAEGILPGIITDRINLTYLILAALMVFFADNYIHRDISEELKIKNKKNRWIFPAIFIFFFLLLIQSAYKLGFISASVMVFGLVLLFFLVFDNFRPKKID